MSLSNLMILGTGSYLPEKVVKAEDFAGKQMWAYDQRGQRVGEPREFTTEKLIELTGIYERRIARSGEWPSDMGYQAALVALKRAEINSNDLVGILVGTVTQRDNFPSAAVRIQHQLGAKNVRVAYDLQNACAGYPNVLMTANSLSREFPGYWLAIASEKLTSVNDFTDINSHLFGDGAGAAILGESKEGKGIVGVYSRSEPFDDGLEMIFRDSTVNCIRMPNGAIVLKNAVGSMVDSAIALKRMVGWSAADVYIPHQANERIIAGVERKLGEGIVYRNVARYGNMSAATCAVALHEAIQDGTIRGGSKVIVTSFGAGLVTSAVAIQF